MAAVGLFYPPLLAANQPPTSLEDLKLVTALDVPVFLDLIDPPQTFVVFNTLPPVFYDYPRPLAFASMFFNTNILSWVFLSLL